MRLLISTKINNENTNYFSLFLAVLLTFPPRIEHSLSCTDSTKTKQSIWTTCGNCSWNLRWTAIAASSWDQSLNSKHISTSKYYHICINCSTDYVETTLCAYLIEIVVEIQSETSITPKTIDIYRTLERSMNTTITRVQDQISLLASLVRNGLRKEVWSFVVKNFDAFHERFVEFKISIS